MRYQFNKEEQRVLDSLGFNPFKDYDDEESEKMLNSVADHLLYLGFDEDYNANEIGIVCENIITKLTKYY